MQAKSPIRQYDNGLLISLLLFTRPWALSWMLSLWRTSTLALAATILNEQSLAQTTDAICLPYFDWVPSVYLSSAIIPKVQVYRCLTRSIKAHALLPQVYQLFVTADVRKLLLSLAVRKITNVKQHIMLQRCQSQPIILGQCQSSMLMIASATPSRTR